MVQVPFVPPVADTEIGRQFAQDGYYLAKGVFSKEEVAELEADFDRIVAQISETGESVNAAWGGPEVERMGEKGKVVIHTHNVQQYSAAWLRAFMHPKFLAAASSILGESIILQHSKLFQKPPERGAPFPMHQDWDYFPTIHDSMIAGVVHVSRATDEMGCLRVVPGSQSAGRVAGTSGHQESEFLNAHPLESATPCPAEPGDVLFFHYFTLHGSMPNRSSETRKTVLVQMHRGDDKVEDGVPHPNERLVLQGFNRYATRETVNG